MSMCMIVMHGLICLGYLFLGGHVVEKYKFYPRTIYYKIDRKTGLVKNIHWDSVFDNADNVTSKGFIAYMIDMSTFPNDLVINLRG